MPLTPPGRIILVSAWLATSAMAAPDSVVTFNEVHFHPADPVPPAVAAPEWIELHNQMSIRVDLGGWTIRGGVNFTFPEGTVVESGAMVVVSQVAGQPAGALGPWTGRLDNSGEKLTLHERWGRMMDVLGFGDAEPWPTAPDGSGPSLAKTRPDALSDDPTHWAASAQAGGTPGAENFPAPAEAVPRMVALAGSSWKYQTTTPPPEWTQLAGFSDATWAAGPAPLGTAAPATPPAPATTLPPDLPAWYFRKVFAYGGGLPGPQLLLSGSLKGRAVFHLNGLARREAAGTGAFAVTLPVPDLQLGTNVLAIEIRPGSTTPDVVLDLALTLLDGQTGLEPAPPPHQPGPVVINEIAYHSRPTYPDPAGGIDFAENPAEWIELHNPGTGVVDLSGWKLRGGIDYEFPLATALPPGGFTVVTNHQFAGSLGNDTDTIRLRDATGQVIDEVTYFDSGRWPQAADGGGSSLELLDPAADNRCAESWAASDESARSAWQTVTYRATGAEPQGSNNPSTWREFLLGFLDVGEALIDDVTVVEDPDTVRLSLIQNGTFEGDTIGGGAAHWRLLGTHKLSRVEADPDGPGKVLRLVATGEFEHTYNTASTTLANNRAISSAKTYEISFRARWLSGSPQLNSRLYLNRAARTTILAQPTASGTPGAPNSRRLPNAGPTFTHLRHSPLVPAAGQPLRVSVCANDPQGIDETRVLYSVNAGAWQSTLLGDDGAGRWFGVLPGQALNAIVQFYVQGTDSLGATAFFPAGGPASRAVFRVGDGGTSTQPVKNKMRLLMTAADANQLHTSIHSVSNHRWPCTVVYNDREVWYDAGVRLRAAPYGRQGARAGWNISFGSDAPFRGVQKSIVIDGAFNMPRGDGGGWLETTVGPSVNEMLYQVVARRTGRIPSTFDDIVFFQTPRTTEGNRRAQLKMTRFGSGFLEEEFPDGADGTLFKQELIYYPDATVDGNPESLKNAYSQVRDTEIRSFGPSKDSYRINYLIQNNRDRDDYSRLMALGQAFGSPAATLYAATSAVMDADNWMRVFALTALTGLADTYNNGGFGHNIQLYARPRDGKVMLFPWDQDHAFYYSATSSIFGTGSHRLAAVLQLPANRRLFCAHLLELCQTGFTNEYLDPVITHLSTVADRSGYAANFKNWVSQRRTYVLAQLNTLHPAVPFEITSNGGADFSVPTPSTVLEGRGWLDVRNIMVSRPGGAPEPVEVTWLDAQRWRIIMPLLRGANPVTLTATSALGAAAGSDTIVITNTGTIDPAAASNLVISEVHYHPVNEAQEFIELNNVGPNTIDLTGVRFIAGIQFDFTGSSVTTLAAGQRVLVVRDKPAFESRYGTGLPVAGAWSPLTELSNGGDRLTLVDRSGAIIADFSYDDSLPWPPEADGEGSSLTLIRPAANTAPDNARWRPSGLVGGSPGTSDTLAASAYPTLLDYSVLALPAFRSGSLPPEIVWTERLGADDAAVIPEVSNSLDAWHEDPGDSSAIEWRTATSADGARTLTVRLGPQWRFFRLRVAPR